MNLIQYKDIFPFLLALNCVEMDLSTSFITDKVHTVYCYMLFNEGGKEGSSTMKIKQPPDCTSPIHTIHPYYNFKIPCSPLSSEVPFDMQ